MTEGELKESEGKYRDLSLQLPQTAFELDEKGNLFFMNRFGSQALGYTQEDLQAGLNVLQIVSEEDKERIIEDMRRTIEGSPQVRELALVRKNGSRFPAIAYLLPAAKGGRAVGLRGIFLDISERKKTETALQGVREQVQGAHGEVSGGGIHCSGLDFQICQPQICRDLRIQRSGDDRQDGAQRPGGGTRRAGEDRGGSDKEARRGEWFQGRCGLL